MPRHFDAVILGTGNAGIAAATDLRRTGRSVAIVEARDRVGGTCPLRGCVPKKVMVAAAETLATIADAKRHCIEVAPPRLDWRALVDRTQSFTEGVSDSYLKTFAERGIELLHGHARFTGRSEVAVSGETLSADHVVIATGSRPTPLPLDGFEHLITSDDLLSDRTLPQSLIFVGGGVIGLEFSHILARAGCKVTILERGERLLPPMEADAVAWLHRASEAAGIEILTEVEVEEIAPEADGFVVRFRRGGKTHSLRAARIAHGAGRVPDVEDLDLDAAGIDHDGSAIAVTEHLRSVSNGTVYVGGDTVPGAPQLSPLATHEGRVAARNIIEGDRVTPDYQPVPAVVYSVPCLAGVGLTEEAARDQGLRFEAKTTDMRGFLSARLYGDEAAFAKVLIEEGSGRILGAHLVGKRTEELIHLFALAMKHGLGRDDLASVVYAFPTFSSDVKSLV